MATGDTSDIFARLSERVPKRWFGDVHPILDAVLMGIATALSAVYSAYAYMVLQTRLQTSTDGWLDLSAADYFGPNGLPREVNESDSTYLARIQINIIRERGTRNAVSTVLTQLTGVAPVIIEPQRPYDCGGYGFACGYSAAGSYGSIVSNYQAFVTAYRPIGQGIPDVQGYGTSVGGYSQASQADYVDIGQMTGLVSDASIYAAIASVLPAGVICWARIETYGQESGSSVGQMLDVNFILDSSSLG